MTPTAKVFQYGGGGRCMLRCICYAKYLRLLTPGEDGIRVVYRDWYTEQEIPEGKCVVCGEDLKGQYQRLLAAWESNLV